MSRREFWSFVRPMSLFARGTNYSDGKLSIDRGYWPRLYELPAMSHIAKVFGLGAMADLGP